MKKRLSIALCLVLVLSMLFALVGCGKDGDNDSKADKGGEDAGLVGTWEGPIDYTDMINELMSAAFGELAPYFTFKDLKATLEITFDEDGTYEMRITEDTADDFIDNVKKTYKEGYLAMANAMGLSVDDLLAQSGVSSIDELVNTAATGVEQQFGGKLGEGQYKEKDDELYMSSDKDEDAEEGDCHPYELDGDELTISAPAGADDDSMAAFMFPLTLERAN